MTRTIEFPWECPICDTKTVATQSTNGVEIKTVKACKVCGLRESFDGKRIYARVRGLEFDFSVDSPGTEFTKHLFRYEMTINGIRNAWQSKRPVKANPVVELQILHTGDCYEVTFRRRHSDNALIARSYALNSSRRRLIQDAIDQLHPKPDIYLFSSGIMLTWDESKF